jgi:FkbM family methyltransferase
MRGVINHPVVHSAVKTDPVQAVLHGVRGARAVDQPATFLRRQLAGQTVGSYRLRNGMTVSLRHRTGDMAMFTRVFYRRLYEQPESVRRRLRPPLRVVDLGANIGLFSAQLGRDATVTAVEADDLNADVLERMIAANGLAWPVVRGYASNSAGTINFIGGKACLSKADPSGDPINKVDVFPLFAGADLLKMDIEGGEWEILADPRMADEGPPVVVMEWHSMRCPEPDARKAASEALATAGYTGFEVGPPGPNGHLWAWR